VPNWQVSSTKQKAATLPKKKLKIKPTHVHTMRLQPGEKRVAYNHT
jgi:hypothetical protein